MKEYYKLVSAFVILILTLFAPVISHAGGESTPFNKIVFFGDSLTDNGNLYTVDFGFLPKSPPYFEGRFSNGNVWSEQVAKRFYNQSYIDTSNYAVGGETAIFHNPINGFLPYSLTASLDTYLLRTMFSDRSRTLFVIWIGANDYLPQTDPTVINQLTFDVVDAIRSTIESLIYHGGTNFLVINLPDISKSPYAKENGKTQLLSALTFNHNAKLDAAITEIQNSYKEVNIHLYDINKMFVDMFNDIDGFNKKYNTNLTNLTEACWRGGYTLRKNQSKISEDEIARKLEDHLRKQSRLPQTGIAANEQGKLDTSAFAHYVATSPDLLEAYSVTEGAEQGELPCKNPDQYVFWDHIHPTSLMHGLLSKELITYIQNNYTVG